jgi:hypothetical protein
MKTAEDYLFNYSIYKLNLFVDQLYKRLQLRKPDTEYSYDYEKNNNFGRVITPVSRLIDGLKKIHIIPSKGIITYINEYSEIKFYCNIRTTPELLERLEQDECFGIVKHKDNVIGISYEYLTYVSEGERVPLMSNILTHSQFINKFFDYNFDYVVPWQIMPKIEFSRSVSASDSEIFYEVALKHIKVENAHVLRQARRFSQCSFMHDLIDELPDSAIGHVNLNEV